MVTVASGVEFKTPLRPACALCWTSLSLEIFERPHRPCARAQKSLALRAFSLKIRKVTHSSGRVENAHATGKTSCTLKLARWLRDVLVPKNVGLAVKLSAQSGAVSKFVLNSSLLFFFLHEDIQRDFIVTFFDLFKGRVFRAHWIDDANHQLHEERVVFDRLSQSASDGERT